MNKFIITILGFIILLSLVIGIYFLTKKGPSPSNPTTTSSNLFKPLPSPTIPSTNQVTLKTDSGNIAANNFFKSAVKINDSSVYISDNANYSVIYDNSGNDFLIDLYAYSEDQAKSYRNEAENSLLVALDISQADACKLAVHTRVPESYDSALANQDYHLSFCPNSIALP